MPPSGNYSAVLYSFRIRASLGRRADERFLINRLISVLTPSCKYEVAESQAGMLSLPFVVWATAVLSVPVDYRQRLIIGAKTGTFCFGISVDVGKGIG